MPRTLRAIYVPTSQVRPMVRPSPTHKETALYSSVLCVRSTVSDSDYLGSEWRAFNWKGKFLSFGRLDVALEIPKAINIVLQFDFLCLDMMCFHGPEQIISAVPS